MGSYLSQGYGFIASEFNHHLIIFLVKCLGINISRNDVNDIVAWIAGAEQAPVRKVHVMAGLGAALIGAISTFISLPLGWAIGAAFEHSVLPLVGGFAMLGGVSLLVAGWAER